MSQDRKDLKIQALLERMSTDKSKYEDEIANLRVELTIMNQQVTELSAQLNMNQEAETGDEVVA